MKLTLTRYAVRPGKEQLTREWMAVLNQRQAEVQETLSDEKMALEAIFMEEDAKGMALIWVPRSMAPLIQPRRSTRFATRPPPPTATDSQLAARRNGVRHIHAHTTCHTG